MASKRTVQFEFLVEADSRQIDRFHDSLKRIQQTAPVSEGVLTSLREELTRFAADSVKTENSLQGLISAQRDASRNADLTGKEYGKLRAGIRALNAEYERLTALESDALKGQSTVLGSENAYKQRIASLREQAQEVKMTDKAYSELRAELVAVEAQYRKLGGVDDLEDARRKRKRNKLREFGTTASQIGIGGFFGGPEGLLGSTLGAAAGAFGGPGGMAAGAAVGASVGLGAQQIRIQSTAVADLVAQLNLAKTTLAQVSTGQQDYNQKLEFARKVSTDYSVGLQTTIEGYAKITAAAAANGLTLKETESIYKGLLASGVAFGASQDDLRSIILATTQVLSKGKISAEELSGQLGERIPGAVAKFAQATGRSLPQLAKDLRDGNVKIADFVKFAKAQFDDYDVAARIIGSSPEKAGERLNLALTRMAELYGKFFQNIGAGFQDAATAVINWANNNVASFARTASGFALLINDIKYQIKSIGQFGADFGNPSTLIAPSSGSGTAKPGEFSISPKMLNETREESARRAWRTEFEAKLLGGFQPKGFGENKGGNPDLSATGETADDKAAKKAQAAADKQTRLQEQLDSEQRRRDELLANNAIRLADKVFEHQQALVRKRYELENSLIEATRRAQEAALVGPAREALSLTNRLAAIIEDASREVREGRMNVEAMRRGVVSAKASAENTARYADVPGSAAAGGGSGNLGFITANQMRAWLKSQGYERTSGDFTNKGHRTPNHMLNAIDIGELDGSYGFAVQRAKQLEARLRATGAFGDQLFGPTRDPRGHKDHVHVPTPGGRIAVTPALSQLMGLGGAAGRTQPGVAGGLNRNTTDLGGVQISEADLRSAQEQQTLLEQNTGKLTQQRLTAEILGSTEAYRSQTQSIKDQQQELMLRNRLQAEGVKPEIIDQQLRLDESTRVYTRNLDELRKQLAGINEKTDPLRYAAQIDAINQLNAAYKDQITAQQDLNAVINEKKPFGLGQSVGTGIDNYLESIGTLDEAVQGLAQGGFGGISSAIRDLVTTGSADFKSFATGLLSDMADIIAQQLIVAQLAKLLKQLLSSISGGPSGGGGGEGLEKTLTNPDFLKYSSFANGGVMTDHGPLKMQTYASGGIANSPQFAEFGEGSMPEAYVPLPDGRSIPVSLKLPYQRQAGGAADAPYQRQAGGAADAPLALPFPKAGDSGATAAAEQQAAMDAMAAADKPLRIEYSRVGAGDLPFVTEDQHRRGMAQAAQAGEAAALRRLRTSPATRRRIGV